MQKYHSVGRVQKFNRRERQNIEHHISAELPTCIIEEAVESSLYYGEYIDKLQFQQKQCLHPLHVNWLSVFGRSHC